MLRQAAQRVLAATAASGVGSRHAAARCLPQAEAAVQQWQRYYSSEEEKREISDPAVQELAEKICQLNLLQVSDLTELLKQRLGLQTPTAGFGMPMGFAAPAAAAPAAAAEAAPPKEEKTEFDVKLEGFDAAAKIKASGQQASNAGVGVGGAVLVAPPAGRGWSQSSLGFAVGQHSDADCMLWCVSAGDQGDPDHH